VKAFHVSYNNERALNARIVLPSSKSESNRLLLIKALCVNNFLIRNISLAADTVLMQQLTEKIKKNLHSVVPVKIDVNNAGTVMRFLIALLAVTPGKWHIYGDERMNCRPVGILVKTLQELGADIKYTNKVGYPPLMISGKNIDGGEVLVDGGISSQFISALMLVAPTFRKGLTIHLTGSVVSFPYIIMTAHVMKHFGVDADINNKDIYVNHCGYIPSGYTVEADWSAASYWYEMAVFSKEAEVKLINLSGNSQQGDSVLPAIFNDFGIRTEFNSHGIIIKKISRPQMNSFEFDCTDCPDLALTLAVTCAGSGIKTRLTGLKTLKIKETDRLVALHAELNSSGYPCSIENDETLIIESRRDAYKTSCHVKTYKDHRMAMAFAPFALLFKDVIIEDPEVVVKSYPGFWNDLKVAGFTLENV